MTENQTEETKEAVEAAVNPSQSRLERWIEDPFASAYLATFSTACAVAFVLGGMTIIQSAIF